ncbi:Probable bacteriophage integrase [Klebsiella sp. PL-2018]|nr:Probable bacteriophage integrase [Klebsiella sp. PL-2018]
MRAFLWQYENSTPENGFANATPPDAVGVVCVSSLPPKERHWLLNAILWTRQRLTKPWLGESVDRRTLKDVIELWFKLHSKSLTAGEHVYDKLVLMVNALGNPIATDLSSKLFAHYRDKRLTGEIYFSEKWRKGASPVTINLEQSYLSGVFSELARLGEWAAPNPLENMRKFTIAEKEMA